MNRLFYSPLNDMTGISDVLRDFFKDGTMDNYRRYTHGMTPPTNIIKTDDSYIIEIESGGLHPENIEITYVDGVLKVSAEKSMTEYENSQMLVRGISYQTVHRSIKLPDIDEDNISADYINGVITIKAPLSQSKVKQIHVNSPMQLPEKS